MLLNFPKMHSYLLFDIYVMHNFLTSSATVLQRSDVAFPNNDKTIILRHPSGSSSHGLKPLFVLIAVFFISSSSISRCLLDHDVLTLRTEVFHMLEVKYHRSDYWLIS